MIKAQLSHNPYVMVQLFHKNELDAREGCRC